MGGISSSDPGGPILEILCAQKTKIGNDFFIFLRIINVSSRAHHFGVIHWKDVNFYKSYDAYKAYAQSKLALVMHTKELSRRLAGSNVRAFSVNPGKDYLKYYGLRIRIVSNR